MKKNFFAGSISKFIAVLLLALASFSTQTQAQTVYSGQFQLFSSTVSAYKGGAIDSGCDVPLVPVFSATFNTVVSSFSKNTASYGGAIYNGAPYDSNTGGVFTFNNNSFFYSNTAGVGGGAIMVERRAQANFNGNATFVANSALGSYGGGAISVANMGVLNFNAGSTVLFASNTANSYYGGAISLRDGSGGSTANFSGKADFVGNQAGYGGALATYNYKGYVNNINFNGGIVNFISNKATVQGGAIWLGGEAQSVTSNIKFTGSTVLFSNNTAPTGNAIYVDGYNILQFINSRVIFANNALTGNQIYVNGYTTNVQFDGGTIVFSSYTAGSFTNDWSRIGFNASNPTVIEFSNNFGVTALNATDWNEFTKYQVNVINNVNSLVVQNGGFLSLTNQNVSLTGAGNILFQNNAATISSMTIVAGSYGKYDYKITLYDGNGGALYLAKSTMTFNDVVTFSSNTAGKGTDFTKSTATYYLTVNGNITTTGVFHIGATTAAFNVNSNAGNGGAISLSSGAVTFNNKVQFSSNNALFFGGAIEATYGSVITFNSTSTFTNNYLRNLPLVFGLGSGNGPGSYGGAVYVYKSAALFNSDILFQGNTAAAGGALYVNTAATATFTAGNASFIANQALIRQGGALHTYAGNTVFKNNIVIFTSNTAQTDGGAIFAAGGKDDGGNLDSGKSFIDFKNNILLFSYNKANGNGGAIYTTTSSFITFNALVSSFIGNASQKASGGALYLGQSSVTFSSNVYFANNTAGNVDISTSYVNSVVQDWRWAGSSYSGPDYTTLASISYEKYLSELGAGGAIYVASSQTYNFNGQNTEFVGNGGDYKLVRLDYSINTTTSYAIIGEGGTLYGGAIYLTDSSTMNFNGAVTKFTNNKAWMGGAIYSVGTLNFNNGLVTFDGNSASYEFSPPGSDISGGAIYSYGKVNFNNVNAIFSNNHSSVGGGAMGIGGISTIGGFGYVFPNNVNFQNPSQLNINNSTLTFSGNSAMYGSSSSYTTGAGGALSVGKALLNAKNSDISFTNNNALGSGALFVSDAKVVFDGGKVTFMSNKAMGGIGGASIGGGAYNMGGGAVGVCGAGLNFINGVADFTSNEASIGLGGAIAIFIGYTAGFAMPQDPNAYHGMVSSEYSSSVTFISEQVNFTNNKAMAGGAIYFISSAINSTGTIIDNYGNSGTTYMMSGYLGKLLFDNSNVVFTGNTASQLGGAIYAAQGLVNFNDSAMSFTNNSAGVNGGAIYLTSATLNIAAAASSVNLSFSNNTANGVANDIYAENSVINFNANNAINISNGMQFSGVNNVINKTGAGNLNLTGVNRIQGAVLNIAAGTVYLSNSSLTIEDGAIISSASLNSVTALYAVNGSYVKVLGSQLNSFFNKSSSSNNGGAIYNSGSTIYFEGPVSFLNNQTGWYGNYFGGALFSLSGNTTFNSDALFQNNRAYSSGGAVLADYSSVVNFNGNAKFINNTGTAVDSRASSVVNFNGNSVLFTSNTISNGDGGAIHVLTSGKVNFYNSNADFFYNNSSGSGGAIAFYGGSVFIDGSANFIGNKAGVSGGAIYIYAGSVTLNATLGNIVFASNTANGVANDIYLDSSYSTLNLDATFLNKIIINGGIQSNSLAAGVTINKTGSGTLYISGNNYIKAAVNVSSAGKTALGRSAVIIDNSKFLYDGSNFNVTDNSVFVNKGGVFLINNSTAVFNGQVKFSNNKSIYYTAEPYVGYIYSGEAYGGALGVLSSKIDFNSSVLFENNSVGVDLNSYGNGGAIYMENSVVNFNDKSVFKNNYAGRYMYSGGGNGSGIYALNSQIYFNSISSFTGNRGDNATSGGAIYVEKSTLAFSAAAYFEDTSGGGAVAAIGSYLSFTGGPVNFINNVAAMYSAPGALYAGGNSIVSFDGIDVFFIGGKANHGAGALNTSISTVTFNGGSVVFSNNITNTAGGALENYGSSILFNNVYVEFNSNRYELGSSMAPDEYRGWGGAIKNNGIMNFVGSTVTFIKNEAEKGGGAIYETDGGLINFVNSDVYFVSNTARLGAVIYAVKGSTVNFSGGYVTFAYNVSTDDGTSDIFTDATSTVTFSGVGFRYLGNSAAKSGGALALYAAPMAYDSGVNFSGNSSEDNGGAVAAFEGSTLTITNSSANFSDNTSGANGGALYSYLADINFADGSVDFNNNTAAGAGGAVFAIDDFTMNNMTAKWNGNVAVSSGGAIWNEDTVFSAINSILMFTNNRSGAAGGAIYSGNNSNMTLDGSVTFSGNQASGLGGAIYLENSTMTLSASKGNMLFSGNTAGGAANDIYLGNNANLNFVSSAAVQIILKGGLQSDASATGIIINKTGTGVVALGGTNEVNGTFNVTEGELALIDNASYHSGAGGFTLSIANGGTLNLANGKVNIVQVDIFKSEGNLQMDVFAAGYCDTISGINSATVSGNISLRAGVGVYNNQVFALLGSMNLTTGTLTNSITGSGLTAVFDMSDAHNLKVIVNGVNQSNFGGISGLSDNQLAAAKALDAMSITDTGAIIDTINGVLFASQAEQEALFTNMSGYFISNVIRGAGVSDKDSVYQNISANQKQAIWAQGKIDSVQYGEDANSIGKVKAKNTGISAGYSSYLNDNTTLGVYGKYNAGTVEQTDNSADIANVGLGVYGGYIKETYEFKALISGSYDTYDTTRFICADAAQASFKGFSVGADVEGAIKAKLGANTTLRPYIGLEAKNINYSGFTETSASALALDVDGGNYFRSAARAGARLMYGIKSLNLYVNGEAKYLLSGATPEIEARIAKTSAKYSSVGFEEKSILFGVGIGAELKLLENLNLSLNGSFAGASGYSNLSGNLGLSYKLK